MTKDLAEMLARAEATRQQVGFEGTLAEMLDAGLAIFVWRHAAAKVERAEQAAGKRLT